MTTTQKQKWTKHNDESIAAGYPGWAFYTTQVGSVTYTAVNNENGTWQLKSDQGTSETVPTLKAAKAAVAFVAALFV